MIDAATLSQLEQQNGLPSGLLSAVMAQESGGNPNAVSKSGAQGLFQFMPATAQQYGIDPFDPTQAAQGAARMYSDLSKKYNGDLPSMLAAYNWGQGNVDRHGLNNAPEETRNYISNITGKLGTQVADSGQIATDALPPIPEGFVLQENALPPIPEGFVLVDGNANNGKKPEESSSFIGDVVNNVKNAVQSAKDLVHGNFEMGGGTVPSPKTQSLSDKLFPQGTGASSLSDAAGDFLYNLTRNTSPSDWAGALLEKFGQNPAGKAATVIGGVNPVYNVAGTAISRYVNPVIEKVTGASPDTVSALELMAAPLGLKKAAEINDPTVSALKSFANDVATPIAKRSALRSGELAPADLTPAMQKVYNRLQADFPEQADFNKALNSYASKGGQSLLQTGGERTANLAEGAAMYPSGAAEAVNFFKDKVAGAPDQMKSSLAKAISPDTTFYDTLDNVVSSGRKAASPIYSEAFKSNPSMSSPLINKILATPEGKASLSEAVKNIQNEMATVAKPDKELTALANELSDIGLMGKPIGGVASGLKLRALDQVKKAMDDTITTARRSGDVAQESRIRNLKNSLVSEIDRLDKSGLYAKARATAGDYLSNKDAMENGLNFLKEDPELVSRNYAGYGKAEKIAYKAGVVKAIRNNIDDKYDGRNVAQIFEKPAVRQRLQSILPAKEYQKLLQDAQATDQIFKLRNQIVGNSRTALRQIAATEFDAPTQEFINSVVNKGWKSVAIDSAIDFVKRRFDGLSDRTAAETAKILYETDPKAKFKIVKQLMNRAKLEPESVRGTDAAKALKAFYLISDNVANYKKSLPQSAATGGIIQQKQTTKK